MEPPRKGNAKPGYDSTAANLLPQITRAVAPLPRQRRTGARVPAIAAARCDHHRLEGRVTLLVEFNMWIAIDA